MYEDLAEFNNLWFNHQNYLRSLARENPTIQEKYRFFSNLYNNQYLRTTFNQYPDTLEKRVWDTTQIY
jgi:hypothetical protein